MEYTVTKSLCNFEFWSGARDFSRRLTTDEFEQIEDFLISDVLGLDIDEFWKRN